MRLNTATGYLPQIQFSSQEQEEDPFILPSSIKRREEIINEQLRNTGISEGKPHLERQAEQRISNSGDPLTGFKNEPYKKRP